MNNKAKVNLLPSTTSVECTLLILLLVLAIATLFYTISLVFYTDHLLFDQSAFQQLSPYINDRNTVVMTAVSFFGSTYFLLPANILIAVYFSFVRRTHWNTFKVVLVSLGSVTVMSLLKLYFQRIRPVDPIYPDVTGYSFPSGHAMSSMTFYGMLIYFAWTTIRHSSLKWLSIILLIIAIFLIGLSRVYLKVHYATDVLAGYAFGIIWLIFSLLTVILIEYNSKNKRMQ